MKNLPNKEFTEREIYDLLYYYKIGKGSEAVVCEGLDGLSAFKIFVKNLKINPMSENKEKKIELLYQLDLDYSTKILSTISCNGKIIGYEMSSAPDYRTYNMWELPLNKQELIHYLKQTKIILEYLKSKGVIYLDFDPRNILYDRNTGNIMLCDMDNVEVGGYEVDALPGELIEYKKLRGIDFGVHPYMHNSLLLKSLGEDAYTLSYNWNRRKYFKKSAYKTLDSMLNPTTFDDNYLIDHIKKLKR